MKFLLTFKDPDILNDRINWEKASNSCFHHAEEGEDFQDDCEACEVAVFENEKRIQAMENVASKFVQYGETITVEFDTEDGTAKVICLNK